ncbi:hypothetical protein F5X99DRAFT_418185 [Biscogniauxia marginata]|nr:hypothetical protein F5X99DRAFT_418185 [Biscogniauxia marginata]
MINEDDRNPSWRAFLIDLDLAIKVPQEGASGAKGKTGTRAFMAIDALLGEQHSFVHDLETFFWVLFWICIHYDGPRKGRVVPTEVLFMETVTQYFTPYYAPLIPWGNKLRRVVFSNNGVDLALYSACGRSFAKLKKTRRC